MSNLRPVFVKYPWLLRPAAILALALYPVVATIQLWVNEWADLKRDVLFYWKLVRYGHGYDKH